MQNDELKKVVNDWLADLNAGIGKLKGDGAAVILNYRANALRALLQRLEAKEAYVAGLKRALELSYGEDEVKDVIDKITQEIHDLR
jgi:hypothetical protein